MEDQPENPWHISQQSELLQIFFLILWKLLGAKLHQGKKNDYIELDITETWMKTCSLPFYQEDWEEEAPVKAVEERLKNWEGMHLPVSVWSSLNVNNAMDNVYLARVCVVVYIIPWAV